MMLYLDRLYPLLHVLALQAGLLALSVAWQARLQDAPHLYVTAAIALGFKAIFIPWALRRMVFRLGIHREIEPVVGIGPTMLAGVGLVALSLGVMIPVMAGTDPAGRQDVALALSVVLIGLLLMVTRRNAVSQVVGFLAIDNGMKPRRHRRSGHAAGGRDQRRFLRPGGADRDRHLSVPHSGTVRHGGYRGDEPVPRRAPMIGLIDLIAAPLLGACVLALKSRLSSCGTIQCRKSAR